MKYIFVFLFLLVSLNASSNKFIEKMAYETNYLVALEKAKKENKQLMMVGSTKSCPWCRKMERQTLSKNNIANFIKENFIALSVDQELKNYPAKYEIKVVPSIFFINPKDETVILKVLGYKSKKEFKKILDKVSLK